MRLRDLLASLVVAVLACPVFASTANTVQDYLLQQQQHSLSPLFPNPKQSGMPWMKVGVKSQSVVLYDEYGRQQRRYLASTAKRGLGEREGSYQTPRGWHRVCDKIGDGAPPDTILFRQAITPWRYTPQLHAEYPEKDWILTRILWLCGQEPGLNQGQLNDGTVVDSYRRFIYIHGAGSHVKWGTPTSLGCIRLSSADVIDLFTLVPLGSDVLIDPDF